MLSPAHAILSRSFNNSLTKPKKAEVKIAFDDPNPLYVKKVSFLKMLLEFLSNSSWSPPKSSIETEMNFIRKKFVHHCRENDADQTNIDIDEFDHDTAFLIVRGVYHRLIKIKAKVRRVAFSCPRILYICSLSLDALGVLPCLHAMFLLMRERFLT